MSRGIKKRLSSENSQRSINQDVTQKVNLENKEQLLPSGEINYVLNVGDEFNNERQSSTKYRLISSIKPVFTNVLFNMSGPTLGGNSGWEVFDNTNFKVDPFNTIAEDLTYTQSYNQKLREINGWFGYFDPRVQTDNLCVFYDMEPKRSRLLFDEDENWAVTITYPYDTDTGHTIVQNGLLIIGDTSVTISKREMTAFSTFTKHGLNIGDTVRLTNIGVDGDYRVIATGLNDGSFSEHYFVLDIKPVDVTLGAQTRMKRIVGGRESTYYFRKFKKVPTTESNMLIDRDYDLSKLRLSNTIFNDPTYQLLINPDIDVNDLKDNLGRPVSELYYTFVKGRTSEGNNTYFSQIKSGLESELVDGILTNPELPDIRQIASSDTLRSLEGNIDISQDDFYGDVVEYNSFEVKENVLAEVSHRFNTTERDTTTSVGVSSGTISGIRPEGYFYKAHHKIQIRDYSNYIEQGDESVIGVPDYAEDLGDGRLLWRDLLDIGFTDNAEDPLDYPFLNGNHYIYQNIILLLKRQDPYNQYGLYYGASQPRDLIGDSIVETFRVNKTDKIC